MSISTNGVLGLMALAFLPRRISPWAAVTGFVASYLCLFAMMWFVQVKPTFFELTYPVPQGAGINFLIWPVVGNLVCFFVGVAVDAIIRPREGTPPRG